jgi:hypothetical protein
VSFACGDAAVADVEEPEPRAERHEMLGPFSMPIADPWNQANRNFYRELAQYEQMQRFFRPIRPLVKNTGQVTANNVRVELIVPPTAQILITEPHEMPEPPKKTRELVTLPKNSLRPAFRRDPGEVIIDGNDERVRIAVDCGSLQPGRWIKSDEFFMGRESSGESVLSGHIYAENLPAPKEFSLTVSVNVAETTMTLDELLRLSSSA